MNTEQREEMEKLISAIEATSPQSPLYHPSQCLKPILQFARQQLNLRVDGEKLREEAWRRWGINFRHHDIRLIEALILECLTTTPEEKE